MTMDPSTTKYLIRARFRTDGSIEKPDVIGAVFGQTEGLLGNELDMRDLQKSARIGRVEVDLESKKGKSEGLITVPSALDKVETAIIGAALEAIDRVGPCKAQIQVEQIEDVRGSRRGQVIERAKELLQMIVEDDSAQSSNLMDEVRSAVQVAEVVRWGKDKLWAGPAVAKSEDVILVEGRNDVLNLLRCGVKNAVSVEGTNVPDSIVDLCKERVTTVFVDGDRGGELIARELLQSCEIDFVARAPSTREVEEIPFKLVQKCLNGRVAATQFASQLGITLVGGKGKKTPAAQTTEAPASNGKKGARDDDEPRGRGRGRTRGKSRDDQDEDEQESRGRGRGRGRSEPAGRGRGGRDDKDDESDDRERGRGRGRGRGTGRDDRDEKDERSDKEDRPAKDDRSKDERPAKDDRPARDDRSSRDKRGRDDAKPSRGPAKKGRDLPGDLATVRDILSGISGSLKAVLLDKDGKELKAGVPVRELAETLKSSKEKIGTVVFDGVVTQRLLDIAEEREIPRVVGVKEGNVAKRPAKVEVLTRAELE